MPKGENNSKKSAAESFGEMVREFGDVVLFPMPRRF